MVCELQGPHATGGGGVEKSVVPALVPGVLPSSTHDVTS